MSEHRQRHQQAEKGRDHRGKQHDRNDRRPAEHHRRIAAHHLEAGDDRGEEIDLALHQHRQADHGHGVEGKGHHRANRAADRQHHQPRRSGQRRKRFAAHPAFRHEDREDRVRDDHPEREGDEHDHPHRQDLVIAVAFERAEHCTPACLLAGLALAARLIEADRDEGGDQREACHRRDQPGRLARKDRGPAHGEPGQHIDPAEEHPVLRHRQKVAPAGTKRLAEIGKGEIARHLRLRQRGERILLHHVHQRHASLPRRARGGDCAQTGCQASARRRLPGVVRHRDIGRREHCADAGGGDVLVDPAAPYGAAIGRATFEIGRRARIGALAERVFGIVHDL